jgi:PAS domain S-box-containing protein
MQKDQVAQRDEMLAAAQRLTRMGSWVAELHGIPDLSRSKVRWSEETYRIFGYAPGAPGDPLQMFMKAIYPDDRTAVEKAVRETLEQGTDYSLDFRIVQPEGTVRRIHAQSRLETDAKSGAPLRMIGAVQDITELHEQRSLLLEQYALQEALFQASADSIYSIDRDFRLTSFNSQFQRMIDNHSGRRMQLGSNVLETPGTLDGRERLRASLGRALAGERFVEHVRVESHGRADSLAGEEQWFEVTRAPIRGAGGEVTGVAVYARNVTQRVQQETEARDVNASLEGRIAERTRELAVLNADLAGANRELEAFAYSISHDLRAPLRAIDGFTRILERDFAPQFPEKAQQHLARIQGAAERMGQLIEGLLAFARLGRQALELRDIDVASVVATALDDLAADREGRNIEIVQEGLGRCRADRVLLVQVFVNLVGNALKYTRGREPARIEIGSRMESGKRAWFVSDNGVGFDMAHSARLFGVFQRLHRAEDYEGTGVGLALVKRIVERHGGRIWAEGTRGHGAKFTFTLES